MMRKSSLLALFFAATLNTSSLQAADQYLVRIPANVNLTAPEAPALPLTVDLRAETLPGGKAGSLYEYDLFSLLSISEPNYSLEEVSWSITGGGLPDGVSLFADGKLLGTPALNASTTTFSLSAAFKGRSGQHEYTLAIAPGEPIIEPFRPWAADFYKNSASRTAIRIYDVTNNSGQSISEFVISVNGAGLSIPAKGCHYSTTLLSGKTCSIYVAHDSSFGSASGTLTVKHSGGQTTHPLQAHVVTPSWDSTLVMNAAVQTGSSTNWNPSYRHEARVDKTNNLLQLSSAFVSYGSGTLPQGQYGINITTPNGILFNSLPIGTSHIGKTLGTGVPLAPGNYSITDIGGSLSLSFTLTDDFKIVAPELKLNGVALTAYTHTNP